MRRGIALAMAVCVLLAGALQAAHFHKGERASGERGEVQCLLCLHAAGSAVPPDAPQAPNISPCQTSPNSSIVAWQTGITPAFYDARGPPLI